MTGRPPRFEASTVRAVAEAALGAPIAACDHLPVGWGNENWRVETTSGERFIVKLGPPASAAKWQATGLAAAVAADRGIPVPEVVHADPSCAAAGGWVVRILRWIDAHPPEDVLRKPEATARFFTEVGAAVRTLHDHPVEGFTSRLDGSAPSFARWDGYVAHRWPQIRARCEAAGAFAEGDLDGFEREVRELAAQVSEVAEPACCHRDLHLGNLLATSDGHLAAILDFDGAEAWDPAIDVVKLRWLVFPNFDGSAEHFAAGYGAWPARWEERVLLVELLELVNTVANAVATGDAAFERSARRRLAEVRGGA